LQETPYSYSTQEGTTIPHESTTQTDTEIGTAQTRAATLALAAIGWTLQDPDRAQRYLDLTGLDPDTLRAGLDDPRILASALDFLANHEPDLLRAAEALAVEPAELVAARKDLAR